MYKFSPCRKWPIIVVSLIVTCIRIYYFLILLHSLHSILYFTIFFRLYIPYILLFLGFREIIMGPWIIIQIKTRIFLSQFDIIWDLIVILVIISVVAVIVAIKCNNLSLVSASWRVNICVGLLILYKFSFLPLLVPFFHTHKPA